MGGLGSSRVRVFRIFVLVRVVDLNYVEKSLSKGFG